jgi:hypothetical protein
MSSACANVTVMAMAAASQIVFIAPHPISPAKQRNPSGPDTADMRHRAPGFALFGRNAGGADQISPGIDLPFETTGGLQEVSYGDED